MTSLKGGQKVHPAYLISTIGICRQQAYVDYIKQTKIFI